MIIEAYNKDGIVVHANEAHIGMPYECTCCRCKMYVKRSSRGTYHFCCKPGQVHMYNNCRTRSESPVIRDLARTNSEEFHQHIMTPPRTGGNHPDPEHPPRSPRGSGDLDERILPCYSLADVWYSGIFRMQNGSIQDGDISKICLVGEREIDAFRTNKSIGKCGIVAKPDYAFINAKRVRFVCYNEFSKDGSAGYKAYKKILDMDFDDEKLFEAVVKKLFRRVEGRKKYDPKYYNVLIYGDWEAVDSSCEEFCSQDCRKCCGYQRANFVSSRQLFAPAEEKVHNRA